MPFLPFSPHVMIFVLAEFCMLSSEDQTSR